MKRIVFFLLGVFLFGATMSCGGGSDKDDCGDIAEKACRKLYDCGYLLTVNGQPVSRDLCGATLNSLLINDGYSDDRCRNEWDLAQDLSCDDYVVWLNYF